MEGVPGEFDIAVLTPNQSMPLIVELRGAQGTVLAGDTDYDAEIDYTLPAGPIATPTTFVLRIRSSSGEQGGYIIEDLSVH